jgi:hypothetical protein
MVLAVPVAAVAGRRQQPSPRSGSEYGAGADGPVMHPLPGDPCGCRGIGQVSHRHPAGIPIARADGHALRRGQRA